jgi:hypothetical protein
VAIASDTHLPCCVAIDDHSENESCHGPMFGLENKSHHGCVPSSQWTLTTPSAHGAIVQNLHSKCDVALSNESSLPTAFNLTPKTQQRWACLGTDCSFGMLMPGLVHYPLSAGASGGQ